jgi:hypothetical protein
VKACSGRGELAPDPVTGSDSAPRGAPRGRVGHSLSPIRCVPSAAAGRVPPWWLKMWFLLSTRVSWRALFPSAAATALFWVGMEVVFSLIFSSTVISDDQKCGLIGVVFALMSWLIRLRRRHHPWRRGWAGASEVCRYLTRSDVSRGDRIGSNDDNDCRWPSRLCSRCQTVCRRSGRTATTRFVVISRPNGDPDALLRESGCRLAEVKLAGQ